MGQNIKDFNTGVGNWFSDLGKNIGSFFSDLGKSLGNWFSTLWGHLTDIISYINPFSDNFLGKKLIELLRDLLKELFVPDEEHITALTDSVKSKFGFIDTIKDTSNQIKAMFENEENLPQIKITIPENKWYSGDITIDFSWYSKYKQYGDYVISGFLYVMFFWRIFIKLSSIISGAGGDIQSGVEVYNDPDHSQNRSFRR